MEKTLKLRRAIVISNDDSSNTESKLSRIKVKILPENQNVDNDLLPWAEPFFTYAGSSSSTAKQYLPEKDSYVYVLILDDYWQSI